MKKLLLTAVATLVCFGVFAQGKLGFINSADQLIYFTTDTSKIVPADVKTVNGVPLAGQTLYSGAGGTISSLAGTPTIVAALFGGVTSDALTLQTTTTFGDVNSGGFLIQANSTFPTLAAGVPAFFRIDIYDSRATSAANAWAQFGLYAASTGVFTAVPSSGAYSPIYQTGAPVNSTMPIGTFVPLDYVGFPGFHGSMEVWANVVPEPGMFALAGLGAAVLMIFRRRK